MIYKKLQIGVGFCNLFTGYLPMITNIIYGSGLLKVAGRQKNFTLKGWNGILGVVNGGKWIKSGQGSTDRFWELVKRPNEAFGGGNIFGRDIFIP